MKYLWSIFLSCFLWLPLTPFMLDVAGAASNQLCIISNHDKMPVLMNEFHRADWMNDAPYPADGMMDNIHCLMTKDTHLNALGDIFDFHSEIDSIGDLLLTSGENLQTPCFVAW